MYVINRSENTEYITLIFPSFIFYLCPLLFGFEQFDHSKIYDTPSSTPYYDRISEHLLQSPVEARYVIIRLTEYDFNTAGHLYNVLRTELYGCDGLQAMQTGKQWRRKGLDF